jgi:hypothetical protein
MSKMSVINHPPDDRVKPMTDEERVFGVGFERDAQGRPIERGHGAINHARYVAEEARAAAKKAKLKQEEQEED